MKLCNILSFVAAGSTIIMAGCQTSEIGGTPRSVSYNFVNELTMRDATTKAQAHCQQYNRDAELVPDSNPDGIATFKCVDR